MNIPTNLNVVPLNSLGGQVKLTSISKVSENSLDQCISLILESNAEVRFIYIEYLSSIKKVIFYTDKDIDITSWENRFLKEAETVKNADKIILDLNNILTSQDNLDSNYISIARLSCGS